MPIERTYAADHFVECPSLAEMPTVALVRGICPLCSAPLDGKASARVLTARRLAATEQATK